MPREPRPASCTSGDAELFYEILEAAAPASGPGTGPDIVLLHPTPVHHAFWLPAAQLLPATSRLILPDLRGHGRSQAGTGPITMEKLGADLERLLDRLDAQRALLVGCSIGGYALFEAWRRMPQRIAGLAFCCSKPQPDSEANRTRRAECIAGIRQRGTGWFFDTMAANLVGTTARTRAPERLPEIRAMMEAMPAESVAAVQQGLAARPDSTATAGAIRVPTLVIAGGEDGSSTPEEMRVLADAVRATGTRCRSHVLADAGHYAPWEQPETVAALLMQFFELEP